MAFVASTSGDHPAIMPLAPAYSSCAAPDLPPADTTKSLLVFATTPVAAKDAPPFPAGRCTTSGTGVGCAFPAPSYETEVLLCGLVTTAARLSGNTRPHGSTRLGSVVRAGAPSMSATRLVSENPAFVTIRWPTTWFPRPPVSTQVSPKT